MLTLKFGEVGFTVPGQVKVTAGGQSWTKWLSDGKARITLPAYRTTGAKEVTVKYLGSRLTERVARTITIRVVR